MKVNETTKKIISKNENFFGIFKKPDPVFGNPLFEKINPVSVMENPGFMLEKQ